ncbi:hypothetical protein [Microbacterium sp. NPDC080220]|uniref:hypothetical protein n=1 Tax=Microbacterium sp. NPDC080220 TaxID=3161017 RepID=UPI00344A7A6A
MPIQHTVVFRLRHQSGSREKTAFTLANGALGRLHLSGFPHLLSTDRKALVSEAVRVHKDLRPFIRTATPSWPLGLAQRDEQWQALALRDRTQTVLTLWHQDGTATDVRVSLPSLRGRDVHVEVLFPAGAPAWGIAWSSEDEVLEVTAANASLTARVLRLTPQ